MPPAVLDTRPPGLDVPFRPGNTLTVTLAWPADALDGRTFTATLDAVALGLDVDGDTMTITATDAQTSAVTTPAAFRLTETTGGESDDVIIGEWRPSSNPSTSTSSTVTVTESAGAVAVTVAGPGTVGLTARVLALEVQAEATRQALAKPRAELARARMNDRAAQLVFLGDSLTESFSPSARGLRWTDLLSRRLNGHKQAHAQYIPAAANVFSTQAPGDWPGGDVPLTYSATPTNDIGHGADLHATIIPAGAFVDIPYYGDLVNIFYTATPTGPAAAAVTIDGIAAGTLDAQNTPELTSQVVQVGTAGDYGAHTLRITATGAPLLFEGVVVYEGARWGFGIRFDAIDVLALGHVGFQTSHYIASAAWAKSFALMSAQAAMIGIALGVNDLGAGRSAADYGANLVTIVELVDAQRVAFGFTAAPSILFVQMPGVGDAYLAAAWDAADELGTDRCAVLDLAALLPDGGAAGWGLLDAGGHPGDGGHRWIADAIADHIDLSSVVAPPRPDIVRIGAQHPATQRSAWAEALTFPSGVGLAPTVRDTSPSGTTIGERRHRVWLDAGTYAGHVAYQQQAGGGTVQVLVGHTSLGSVATAGADAHLWASLATPVVIESPGWYPVTVRKTAASGAVGFVELALRRTA